MVTPAEPLMVIVPDGPKLEIEATLANKDVGFVHAGQPVEIKVEAFNFTRYGLLHGRVMALSRDVVAPEDGAGNLRGAAAGGDAPQDDRDRQARQPAYVARIALAETGIATEQGWTLLEPGMAVTAEIKTGRRRVISYLLSPLVRYRQEGLRER